MLRRWTGAALAPVLALALAGCSQPPQPAEPSATAPTAAAPAKAAEPTDPRLAQLYDSSCRACHGQAGTGAPRTGDQAAWAPRWAKGLPALMDSVVKGRNGMPAGGQCFSCTPRDFEALIRFMSGHAGARS